ncbi:hypothetical protein NST84_05360 [Paenibacillus sp. FSL R7-0345]|uniref:hypothetical protein n=1 Tax=Paenibacillus sp. FSL R7-0345 TaxID=2954535 RepID=UPI00315A100D
MNKKQRIAAIIVILAVITLMFMWLRPEPFEREYRSVIYTNEAGQTGTTVLALSGETFRGLPGKSSFTGSLTADSDLVYELKLKESGGYFFGHIYTFTTDNHIRTIGIVNASLDLNKLWVMLRDVNERYGLKDQDGYIAGPAGTLEEAQQVARDIISPE